MKTVSDKSCRESKNTHFIFYKFFLKMSYLGDNVEKYDIGIWYSVCDEKLIVT